MEKGAVAGLVGNGVRCRVMRKAAMVCMVSLQVPLAQAQEPVVIATPADAQAFHDAAPFVFAGQPLAVHHSFSTHRAMVLSRPARVIVGAGVRFDLNGEISSQAAPAAAALEKLGPGALALTGDNTYTSNTVLREGTLRVGGASALGVPLYNLEQQRGTVLQLEPDARVFNYMQLTAPRPGDVALPGLEDEAHWRVESGSATLANNVNSLVPVRKTGEGSLRIVDTVQSQSSLRVSEGALVVDGMVTGRVDIEAGARLEGGGALAGVHVHGGGMLAPGGRQAAARLTSWRDVTFEPGSLFHVNAYPDGRADELEVLGVARLDGRVWAEAAAGEWAPEHRYRILSAAGGLNGTVFDGVDAGLAFLTPALDYDANNVYLWLSRNDLGIGDVGETPDDKDVGDAIDPPGTPPGDEPGQGGEEPSVPPVSPEHPATPETPGPESPDPGSPSPATPEPESPETPGTPGTPETPDAPGAIDTHGTPGAAAALDAPGVAAGAAPDPLQAAVLGMGPDDARTALRQLSGSWHASVRGFVLEDSRYVREAVLAAAPDAPDAPDDAGGLAGEAGSRSDSRGASQATSRGSIRLHGLRTWAHSYAATGGRDSRNGVPADRYGSRGVVMGFDAPAGRHWRLGGVFAGQWAALKREGGQASADIDSVHAGLAAHGAWNGMRLTAAVLHAWHRIDSRRQVSAGRLHDFLAAGYAGRSVQAFVEVAPAVRGMGPFLRHAWVRLRLPGFQEAGGAAAHGVEPAAGTMNATLLGWRLRRQYEGGGWPLRLDAEFGWRQVLGGTRVESTQRFGTGPHAEGEATRSFASQGLPLTRNAVAVGLGLSAAPARHLRVSARYSGLHGGGARSHAAWADLRWAF